MHFDSRFLSHTADNGCFLVAGKRWPKSGSPCCCRVSQIKAGVDAGALRQIDADLLYAAYFGVVTETIGYLLTMDDPPAPEQGAAVVTQLCFAVLGLSPV